MINKDYNPLYHTRKNMLAKKNTVNSKNFIRIRGAREHNLKGICIDIPRDKFVVMTGLSGSGKSSLAFDTIYAEGQRRYMESLSSYARQFLGQMEKPKVESIEGLSPAISIDQKSTNRNPRSTVGTVTEIYDYLRLLYARAGVPHCPNCGKEIHKQTVDQMVDEIMKLPEGKKIGESWEVSAHPHGMGIVENGALAGQRLDDIYKEYKGELTGKKVYEKYPNKFPLLIKYLDVNDRLSIQVHPSDEVALKKHNEFGKSESWYIMEASDDATLILGMKPGITKEKFLEKVKKNDFDGLFEEKSVKKGDFIDITPGTVHASLKGSVIFAEIQQNSDVTYRIYDFDRIDKNGKKRELHLQDSADVIDFGKEVEIKNTDFDESENEKDILRKNIIEKEYYSIDKIRFNGSFEDVNNESMTIYSFLEGEGKIVWGENEELLVKKGETILIPAGIKTKTVGKFEILRTII